MTDKKADTNGSIAVTQRVVREQVEIAPGVVAQVDRLEPIPAK